MATSTIKGGVTKFSGTRGSIAGGDCFGTYDRTSGLVRITVQWRNTSDTAAATALYTIPSEYRPLETKYGAGIVIMANGNVSSSYILGTDGTIKQQATNSARGGFCYIEYVL